MANKEAKQPKLTIITVNLNNREGLLKTLNSVVSQTFTEFEYIVVDGGSTDGSAGLIEEFAVWKAPDIKGGYQACTWDSPKVLLPGGFFSEPDTGIYHAMNKGIAHAKGEYLLFLNSGDFLVDDNVLQKVFEFEYHEDIVIGNCFVSENGKVIFHAIPPDQISFSAFYGRTIPHQSAFIRRDLFERYGLYNENYRIHSDYEFFVKTLIVNHCSYRHVPVTIADYNMEGLSSSEVTKNVSKAENDDILQRLIPDRIILDYQNWEKERQALKPWYWITRKPFLHLPLMFIFNLATFLANKKRKFSDHIKS